MNDQVFGGQRLSRLKLFKLPAVIQMCENNKPESNVTVLVMQYSNMFKESML